MSMDNGGDLWAISGQNEYDLRCVSERQRRDKNFVLEVVRRHGRDLKYASKDLRGDREVVLEAVKQNGWALRYASEDLRGSKEVVLEAVKQNGMSLENASDDLREDKEVVLTAIENNRAAISCAPRSIHNLIDDLADSVDDGSTPMERLRRYISISNRRKSVRKAAC